MWLPNGSYAIVDDRKLAEYCLSPVHLRGRHKARLFAAALGYTLANATDLKAALLDAARGHDAPAVRHNGHSQLYEITFDCVGPAGTAGVVSVWIVPDGELLPQLVTCYPA